MSTEQNKSGFSVDRKGVLYGVGVGPGDPELMTLKAVRILKEADLIVLPEWPPERCEAYEIAVKSVPEISKKMKAGFSIPMTHDRTRLDKAYGEGIKKLLPHINKGERAAFLTIGDPTVYSTFSEVRSLVEKQGIRTETISGVPSFCAAAAALNTELVKGHENLGVFDGRAGNLEGSARTTEVYMKTGRGMPELTQRLRERMKSENLFVMAVSNCGKDNEIVAYTIDEIPDNAGYMTTVIVKKD